MIESLRNLIANERSETTLKRYCDFLKRMEFDGNDSHPKIVEMSKEVFSDVSEWGDNLNKTMLSVVGLHCLENFSLEED